MEDKKMRKSNDGRITPKIKSQKKRRSKRSNERSIGGKAKLSE